MSFSILWYNALDKVNALPRTGTDAFFVSFNGSPHGISHTDPVLEDHEHIADHKHEDSGEHKGHIALPGLGLLNYLLLPLVKTVL